MKNIYSSSALAVLAVLFIVLTMLSSIVFKGWRLDLTENNLYTLSEGTVNIAESLDQKIRLRLYFSDSASEDLPQIRSYAERVWELMQEPGRRRALPRRGGYQCRGRPGGPAVFVAEPRIPAGIRPGTNGLDAVQPRSAACRPDHRAAAIRRIRHADRTAHAELGGLRSMERIVRPDHHRGRRH